MTQLWQQTFAKQREMWRHLYSIFFMQQQNQYKPWCLIHKQMTITNWFFLN